MSNCALNGVDIDLQCRLSPDSAKYLNSAATRLGWSGRSMHRCLKVARTIADLAGSEHIATAHLAEAVQYRRVLQGPKVAS
jgi:magnesium chelatase family protein